MIEIGMIRLCYRDLWPEGHQMFQFNYPIPWIIRFAKREYNISKKIPPYEITEEVYDHHFITKLVKTYITALRHFLNQHITSEVL